MISLEELLRFDYDKNPVIGLTELWNKIPASNLLMLVGRSLQELSAVYPKKAIAYMYDIDTFKERGIIYDCVNVKVPSYSDWKVYNVRPLYYNNQHDLKHLLTELDEIDWLNNPKDQIKKLIQEKLSNHEK